MLCRFSSYLTPSSSRYALCVYALTVYGAPDPNLVMFPHEKDPIESLCKRRMDIMVSHVCIVLGVSAAHMLSVAVIPRILYFVCVCPCVRVCTRIAKIPRKGYLSRLFFFLYTHLSLLLFIYHHGNP